MRPDLHEAYEALFEALGRPAHDGSESDEIAMVREATRRILGLPMVEWQRTRTIATLPSARLTPQVALARTLEKATYGKLKSVYIGIHWAADDTFTFDYSSMAVSDLAMHRLVIERRLSRIAFDDREEDGTARGV